MSKLTKCSFYADFLSLFSSHTLQKEPMKDGDKLGMMNSNSSSSKKTYIATPSNKPEKVKRDKKTSENKTMVNSCNSTPSKGYENRIRSETHSSTLKIANKCSSENKAIKSSNSTPIKSSSNKMNITPSNKPFNTPKIVSKEKNVSENKTHISTFSNKSDKTIKDKNNYCIIPIKGGKERKKQWEKSYTESINKYSKSPMLQSSLKTPISQPSTPISLKTPQLNKSMTSVLNFSSPIAKSPKPRSPVIVDIESDDESLSSPPVRNKGLTILSFKTMLLSEYDLNLIKDGWLNDADIDFFSLYSLFYISNSKRIDKYYIFPSFLSLYLFKSIEKIDHSWFKHLNLRKVKYLIFPINLDMHWSLAILVNANKYYKKYKNSNYEYKENSEPFIMLMDSIGLHSITKIQEKIKKLYCQLYNQEQEEEEEEGEKDKKKLHQPIEIKYKKLDLPKQENARDCGVFVLFYLFYFLQSSEVLDYNNVTEWSKKCNFPRNSIFLRSYLMYWIHEIYIEKNREERDENYRRNKKIINSLYRRDNLSESLLLQLLSTCHLLPMNGLIKQKNSIEKNDDKKIEKKKNVNDKKEEEKEEENLPSVDDILDGKTLNNNQNEINTPSSKRKFDNNNNKTTEENEKKKIKKDKVGYFEKIKNIMIARFSNKPNDSTSPPVIPDNATNNIKNILPKELKILDDIIDYKDLPPVTSLHDNKEKKKGIKRKKNENKTDNVKVNEKEDATRKKRKKGNKENENNHTHKKNDTLQSKINISEKTKNELNNIKTPTKKK